MKKILINLTIIAFISLAFTSCGNVEGMWIQQFDESYSNGEYWLTMDEELNFEYIISPDPFAIDMYYIGTYVVDSSAKTITFTATKDTNGISEGSKYVWNEDTTWTQTATYTLSGKTLNITIDGVVLVMEENVQPVTLMRAINEVE